MANLFLLPLIAAVTLLFNPNKKWALAFSILTFVESFRLFLAFDKSSSQYQFIFTIPSLNNDLVFGIDGISIFFILLTTFLIPICLLVSWYSITFYIKQFLVALFFIEWILIAVFSVIDVLGFYIFYEAVLIPVFLIIGVWGARVQKINAAYYFFFYTLIGSLLMFISILLIFFITGSTDLHYILAFQFSDNFQILIFLAFFASFAVKLPAFPFHIWLPLAHVEAPVAGSVLLAGVLIKLGSYGLIRFSLAITPWAAQYFAPLVFTLAILGVIYASLATIRQTDLKRIIAYSSIGHMGIVTIGIFSFNVEGIVGSIFLQLAHGIVSSALFIVVTLLYDRFHTRIFKYFRGVTLSMPLFSSFFLFFTLGNIAVPGTSNFIGEILSLAAAVKNNIFVAVMAASGMVLSAAYGLFLFNRICFGGMAPYMLVAPRDLSRRETLALAPLAGLSLLLGLFPAVVIDVIIPSVVALFS